MAKNHPNGRRKTDAKHVRFYEWELKSAAYRSLNVYSRSLLTELRRRYNGENNGYISMSVREAAVLIPCAVNTARKAFGELKEKGFIRIKQKGAFTWKQRHATMWILTNEEYAGKLKTIEFMSWSSDSKDIQKKTRDQHIVLNGITEKHCDQSPESPHATNGIITRYSEVQNLPSLGITTYHTNSLPYGASYKTSIPGWRQKRTNPPPVLAKPESTCTRVGK